jgi:hypothetical protein
VLARTAPTDSVMLAAMAKIHLNRSRVLMMVSGDPAGAARESQQAIELASTVAAARPDDLPAQWALAEAYQIHAYEESFAGHHATAAQSSDKAVAIMEGLYRLRPDNKDVEARLLRSYSNRLTILPYDKPTPPDMERGLAMANKALTGDLKILDESKEHALSLWRSIGVDWNNLGIWSCVKGDYSICVDAFGAERVAMEKTTVDSHDMGAALDLVRARINLARAQVSAGQLDIARDGLMSDKAQVETLLAGNNTYEIQYFLAECEEELGTIEALRAAAAKHRKQQLQAWQSAHTWFAKSLPRFAQILKVASLTIWDRPPAERAAAGFARSAAEIHRLEQTPP